MVGYKRKYQRRRHHGGQNAARKIQRAWRRRKGTVARLAMGNRRAIRTVNRKIEKGVLQSVACTLGTNFGGQYIRGTPVDRQGEAVAIAGTPNLVLRPFYGMGNGDLSSQRNKSMVTMSSLTYKFQFDCGTAVANRVGVLIVLDTQPQGGAVQPSLETGPVGGQILDGPSVLQYLRYQNMDTCSGPNCRFKVLKHLKGRCSSTTLGGSSPPNCVFTGTLRGKYRIRYDSAAGSIEPTNQSVLICPYSDGTTAITSAQFSAFMRLRFKDA